MTHDLAELARQQPFPTHILDGCEDALVLFSAAFQGKNDAWHIADAGLTATCVDEDGVKLALMTQLYPDDWIFVHADAFDYVERARVAGVSWDVVVADSFTGDMMRRVLAGLNELCELARRYFVCTITVDRNPEAPDGWRVLDSWYQRNGNVGWLVLERR